MLYRLKTRHGCLLFLSVGSIFAVPSFVEARVAPTYQVQAIGRIDVAVYRGEVQGVDNVDDAREAALQDVQTREAVAGFQTVSVSFTRMRAEFDPIGIVTGHPVKWVWSCSVRHIFVGFGN